MLTKRVRSILCASVLTALFLAGCAHAPSRPATDFEQVMAYNASIALANESVVKLVIAANKDSLLTKEQSELILNAQFRIAQQHKELTALIQGGPDLAKKDAQYIQGYLDAIVAAVDRAINSGVIPPKVRPALESVKFFAGLVIHDLVMLNILH